MSVVGEGFVVEGEVAAGVEGGYSMEGVCGIVEGVLLGGAVGGHLEDFLTCSESRGRNSLVQSGCQWSIGGWRSWRGSQSRRVLGD